MTEISEIRDRMLRMETKLTELCNHMGLAQGSKPAWQVDKGYGVVGLPSLGCSIRDIVGVIPPGWADDTYVMFKGDCVMTIKRAGI